MMYMIKKKTYKLSFKLLHHGNNKQSASLAQLFQYLMSKLQQQFRAMDAMDQDFLNL